MAPFFYEKKRGKTGGEMRYGKFSHLPGHLLYLDI